MDYSTPTGQVRLLIADLRDPPILSDDMIRGFLDMQLSVKRAAADALDAIASSEALLSKVMRTQDRQTNGAAVADALRKHAASLRAQAAAEDESAAEDSHFGIVEFSPYGRL